MTSRTSRLIRIAAATTVVLAAHAVGTSAPAAAAIAYRYGVNYPYGVGAVDYAYSADGMWKDLTDLQYGPNYYKDDDFLTPGRTNRPHEGHPYNRDELVRLAGKPNARYTARDKNIHLLHDFNRDGELDLPTGGFAFHEHNGKGRDGLPPSETQEHFHNFFFDDNWLARHMAQAYGRTEPNGLGDNGDYIRWRVLSGDTNWRPYDQVPDIGSDDVDRLALDGLYYLSQGQPDKSFRSKWMRIRDKVATSWNGTNRLYVYPGLTENYHDRFIRFSVPVTVTSAANSLEFRVWWYGSNRLDIAEIRVR